MMTELAQFYASVVVFVFYVQFVRNINTVTFYTLSDQKQLFCDGDYVNLTNVICGTTACQFEQFEWFLKGPYSWRKPDFGEKSYLWLAFFNLWNRRTKISSVEYLWFYLFLFVLQSLERLSFFYWYSTCASFQRSISNLFVCWSLSKFFPIIIVLRYFLTVLMTAMWLAPTPADTVTGTLQWW